MTFTIWNASARQLLNINNYLTTDDKTEFDVYEDVLNEHDGNEEKIKAEYLESVLTILKDRNYNRDYSYHSVLSYALEGKTLEQVSRDDLRILFDMLRNDTNEFEDASHRHQYYGLMLNNIKKMKNKYPELRNTLFNNIQLCPRKS